MSKLNKEVSDLISHIKSNFDMKSVRYGYNYNQYVGGIGRHIGYWAGSKSVRVSKLFLGYSLRVDDLEVS